MPGEEMPAEENPQLLAEEEEERENTHHHSPFAGDPPEDPDSSSSSACSTPYASAPSSPGRPPAAFYSAPASPIHHFLSAASPLPPEVGASSSSPTGSFEFEFSSRLLDATAAADELFLNGQIRPTWPRPFPSLPDPDDRGRLRSRSVHRRARSMSPLRHVAHPWHEDADHPKHDDEETETAKEPCISASSSQSSSSSRSSSSHWGSRRWVFLKELLLYRSKSEGRSGSTSTSTSTDSSSSRNGRERFWHNLSFSSSSSSSSLTSSSSSSSTKREPRRRKRAQGGGKRKVGASAHERHYAEKRAEAEEMRRRTFLPYRQGLFGCLVFSSKGYGALSGLARTLHTVSSR